MMLNIKRTFATVAVFFALISPAIETYGFQASFADEVSGVLRGGCNSGTICPD